MIDRIVFSSFISLEKMILSSSYFSIQLSLFLSSEQKGQESDACVFAL